MRAARGALVCVALSLCGIGLCVYLGVLHIALLRGELLGGLACGGEGSIFNCHAVTASSVGKVFGVPLWVWGLSGYLATLNLALIGRLFPDWTAKALTLLAGLGLLFVGADVFLFIVMVTQIRYLCLFCLLTYLVNALLLGVSKWALALPWRQVASQMSEALRAFLPSRQRPLAWLFWVTMIVSVSGSLGLHAATVFVSQGSPGAMRAQLREFVTRQSRTPVETAGDPAMGPTGAALELVEFSDFFCPVCQRASRFNAIVLANHRRDVRFIFKPFPLDMSCNDAIQHTLHPGACTVAAAAECAQAQGKFWPFHDRIFKDGHNYNPSRLAEDARQLGLDVPRFQTCLDSGEGLEAVRRDTAEGKRLSVTSTPTYFVNGLRFSGIVTPAVFEELVGVLRENAPSVSTEP